MAESRDRRHDLIGVNCRKHRSTLAEFVACYQHGAQPGYPNGRNELVPLCGGPCAKTALDTDPRPVLEEHEAATARRKKAEATARKSARAAAADAQGQLASW